MARRPVLLQSIILGRVGKAPCTKRQIILQTGVIGVRNGEVTMATRRVCWGERYRSVLNRAD